MENFNANEVVNFTKIIGYNPFLDTKSNSARIGKKMLNSYIYYFDMLSLLSQIAYKWKNRPKEIPIYQFEKCLFYNGQMGFSKDEVVDKYIALPCVSLTTGYDIYGEPNTFIMYSYANQIRYERKNHKDGVICYNNALKKNNYYMAMRYAQRLQNIDDIIDMNIDKQKCPYIIICPDSQERYSLKNLINKLDINTPAIYMTKDLTKDNLDVLDLRVELKSEELLNAKRDIFNEACLYLGITAGLSNKKERLISSEVENETKRYGVYREIGLEPRKYFCEQVKELYNLDLDVEYVLEDKEMEEMENIIVNSNNFNRKEQRAKVGE